MVEKLKNEPVRIRTAIMSILALVAVVVPGVDVGNIEGIVTFILVLVLGESARAKVSPVES